MKSKTVNFNIFSLLLAIVGIIAVFVANVPSDGKAFVWLTIGGWVISQAITFFSPSGLFVGHKQDWSMQKWVIRIGVSSLAILNLIHGYSWFPAITAFAMPIIEIFIRIYGTDTPAQRVARLEQ